MKNEDFHRGDLIVMSSTSVRPGAKRCILGRNSEGLIVAFAIDSYDENYRHREYVHTDLSKEIRLHIPAFFSEEECRKMAVECGAFSLL